MNKTLFEALVIDFTIKWTFVAITLQFLKYNSLLLCRSYVSRNVMNNIQTEKALKMPLKLGVRIKACIVGFRTILNRLVQMEICFRLWLRLYWQFIIKAFSTIKRYNIILASCLIKVEMNGIQTLYGRKKNWKTKNIEATAKVATTSSTAEMRLTQSLMLKHQSEFQTNRLKLSIREVETSQRTGKLPPRFLCAALNWFNWSQ